MLRDTLEEGATLLLSVKKAQDPGNYYELRSSPMSPIR